MSEPNNCTACGLDLNVPHGDAQPPYEKCPNCGMVNPVGPGRASAENTAHLYPPPTLVEQPAAPAAEDVEDAQIAAEIDDPSIAGG